MLKYRAPTFRHEISTAVPTALRKMGTMMCQQDSCMRPDDQARRHAAAYAMAYGGACIGYVVRVSNPKVSIILINVSVGLSRLEHLFGLLKVGNHRSSVR